MSFSPDSSWTPYNPSFLPAFAGVIDSESWNSPVTLIDLSTGRGRGSLHSSACWHGNKWGLTGSWRSSGYGFFNLPDASRWQRLITRWHGTVMFTLSHLFVEPREGAGVGACVCSVCRFCVCAFVLANSDVAASPSGQGVIENVAVISVRGVTRRLTNGITPSPPIPASLAACTGWSLLVAASWVGYNSSSHRGKGLISALLHRPASPLLCLREEIFWCPIVWVIVRVKVTEWACQFVLSSWIYVCMCRGETETNMGVYMLPLRWGCIYYLFM